MLANFVAASANSRTTMLAVSGNRRGCSTVGFAGHDDCWRFVGFDQLNGQYVYGSDLA
jgi:hypothetical protein